MGKFNFYSDGRPQVPFFCDETLDDWGGDLEAFEEYLSAEMERYEEIEDRLAPGQPHEMDFADYETYESERRIFEQTEAMNRHRAMHDRPPQLEPDQHALWYGTGKDKEEAQERLEMKKFLDEQLQKAAEYESLGNVTKARDYRDRAAQYSRNLRKKESEYEYSFVKEEDRQVIEYGDKELSSMVHWSSVEIEANVDRIRGMVEGYRQMSDTEHSFVLTNEDGNYKVSKISHPGLPANQISARVGNHSDETLLRELGAHGVDSRDNYEPESETETEAPAEPEAPEEAPAEAEAPVKQSLPTEKTVVRGIF